MTRTQFGEGACDKTRRYLDAYICNELLVETNHEVLRHLEACPACTAEVATRTRLRGRLKSAVQSLAVPPELPALVKERIRSRQSSAWRFLPSLPTVSPASQRWAMAAAAALVLSAGTWMTYPRPLAMPGVGDRPSQANYIQKISASVAGIFKSALSDHIHCAVFRKYPVNPPAIEEMEAKLGPEYQGLLPVVEPVIPPGYRIVLAHQCTYGGRQFIHLTMRKGSEVISLVVARKENGETLAGLTPAEDSHGVPVYRTSTDQYQIAGFESERYLAFVVSSQSGSKNLQLAAALAPNVRRLLS
ncbi:MAG: hypothetical protein ABI759_28280 [Candidatus Solibacter sp.]